MNLDVLVMIKKDGLVISIVICPFKLATGNL